MSNEKDKPKDKTTTVIVNGGQEEIETKELTFEDLVKIAFGDNPPSGENILITVTYKKGEDRKEGSLVAGESVKVKDGMVFSVFATDKS